MYNVEGDDRLSPDLQHLTTGSLLKIRVFLVRFHNCIFYTRKLLKVKINTNIQLLPSYDANIERCQPEDGCFDNLIVYLIWRLSFGGCLETLALEVGIRVGINVSNCIYHSTTQVFFLNMIKSRISKQNRFPNILVILLDCHSNLYITCILTVNLYITCILTVNLVILFVYLYITCILTVNLVIPVLFISSCNWLNTASSSAWYADVRLLVCINSKYTCDI
jgi:hypothetical protein